MSTESNALYITEATPLTDDELAALETVMTAAEVAEVYNVDPATVRQTIARGAINARKSGATWLILRSAADSFWGYRLNM